MHRFTLLFLSVFVFLSCTRAEKAEKKEIKASEVISLIKKGKHVQIVDKIILDDLNFTSESEPFILNADMLQTEINSNVFFSNCIFMGKVTTNGIKNKCNIVTAFKNNVVFFACDFRGEVDFSRATIGGMFNFSKSTFRKNTNFNNVAVWAKDSYFSEIKAEGNFTMIYASFLGNLYFLDATFDKVASFQETTIKGKLSFNNAIFNQKADFDLMDISGNTFFNYTNFEKGANFSFSKFMSSVEFINTSFKEKGNCEKTFFLNTVRFEGVEPEKDLLLTDTFFGNKYTIIKN